MATSVAGRNKHYYWDEILKRHWLSTSRTVRFPDGEFDEIVHELLDSMEDVISRVTAQLPAGFPEALAEAVLNGMRYGKAKTLRSQ